MTIKQQKHEIDLERINSELRDKIIFIPVKRNSLTHEEIEAFFGGDLMALRDITKLAQENTMQSAD